MHECRDGEEGGRKEWTIFFTNQWHGKYFFPTPPNLNLMEQLYQFDESRARSTLLVDQIHGGVGGARSVCQIKVDLNLVLVNLKLVNLYQTDP
jgi:hypothetical protein